MTLAPDAYIEYAYLAGPAEADRTPDPFNSRTTPNGIGQVNHFFYMPGAEATPLAQRGRGVPSGTVTRHVVEHKAFVVGGKRPVWLYQPPTADPVPLVVVWDGGDYYRRGRLTQIVDNLIAQRRIRPIALALVENGGPARVVDTRAATPPSASSWSACCRWQPSGCVCSMCTPRPARTACWARRWAG